MPNKRICVLIPGFGIGGAQKQCIYLLNELQNDPELDIHLVYFYEGINFEFLNQSNITLHQVDFSSFYNPVNIIRIIKLVKEIQPQVLFSWLHSCDVYAFFIKKAIKKIKWIMTERDSYYPFDLRYKLREMLGKHADLIVCNSKKGKLYWQDKGVASEKIKVVNNIINPATKLLPLNLEGSPVITYAGRLEVQKNIIILTKAFCKLAKVYPTAKFLIIGEGTLKDQLGDIIKSNEMEGRILLIPFQKNILQYFSSTDVFVNVSLHEGMPNTIIENISLGNKIVASLIPEHEDILGVDYPYYVKNKEDIDEIVTVITKALNEQNIDKYLITGKKRLESMSPATIGGRYKELFNQVTL